MKFFLSKKMYTRAISRQEVRGGLCGFARVRIVMLESGLTKRKVHEGARAISQGAAARRWNAAGARPRGMIAFLVDGDLDRALELIAEAEKPVP